MSEYDKAWNDAIKYTAGCVEGILNGNNDLPEDYSDEELHRYISSELSKLLKPTPIVCHHKSTTAHYSWVSCDHCGSVHTDSGWDIARHQWFRNVQEAKFYQKNGRLPEAI